LTINMLTQPPGGIALALGAGGARGLAHIVVLEVLDELGLRPHVIAGSSIGAVIGAAYAAGVPARALRAYVLATFKDRARVVSKLLEARVGKISDLLQRGLGNPVLVDGERILDLFWPEAVPDRFEDLKIPFVAVTTDYHLRSEVRLSSGPLTPAVAASMAIPGLVRPLLFNGAALIDGGAVNPLPYDQLYTHGHCVIAVDVGGAAFVSDARAPEPLEAMLGASQILMNALVQRMIERKAPSILIRPPVDHFGGLDFFKAAEIFKAADTARDEIKRLIGAALQ
jgi:NTE family protein